MYWLFDFKKKSLKEQKQMVQRKKKSGIILGKGTEESNANQKYNAKNQ